MLALPPGRSSLVAAPGLIQAAVAGVRRRGAQDDMLKLENALPGFGGFYIDSADNVVVYMKPSSNLPAAAIRGELASFYAQWANLRERGIMQPSSRARIVVADYSLSELIATENMISSRLLSTPGIVGVGTSLKLNRVKVGFRDSASMSKGIALLISAGAPRGALMPEIWDQPVLTSLFTDRIRNTKGGLQIGVGLRTDPYDGVEYQESGTHGFVVTGNGQKYFMTASHLANVLWGINGKVADTVWQNSESFLGNTRIGSIAISAPWLASTSCPVDIVSQAYPDLCTQSDVALGIFDSADGDKKVTTSTYEGQNGSPGNPNINGYYSIAGVESPEYVKDTSMKGLHKSGYKTGTTTGVIDTPITPVFDVASALGRLATGSGPAS